VGCNKEGALVLGNYKPYSDALLASLLFIELVARNGGNLRNLLDELRATLATPSSQ
jgi:phosphomannomutase